MENTNSMPTAEMPMATPAILPEAKPMKKKDHWLVEVVGGLTVASTMVSALALFYLALLTITSSAA